MLRVTPAQWSSTIVNSIHQTNHPFISGAQEYLPMQNAHLNSVDHSHKPSDRQKEAMLTKKVASISLLVKPSTPAADQRPPSTICDSDEEYERVKHSSNNSAVKVSLIVGRVLRPLRGRLQTGWLGGSLSFVAIATRFPWDLSELRRWESKLLQSTLIRWSNCLQVLNFVHWEDRASWLVKAMRIEPKWHPNLGRLILLCTRLDLVVSRWPPGGK